MTTLTRPHPTSPRPLGPRRRAAGLLTAVTMTGALLAGLAACSSSSDSGATSETSDSSAGSDSGGTEGAPESAPEAGRSDLSESAPDSADDSTRSPAARPPAIARSVISTGTVSLVSDDVADARREVQRVVDAQRGTISEENTETDDEGVATYSRLVIRVPSTSFSETMQALEKAAELRQSQVSSDDVTTEVIDTDVRVRAQEGSLRRVEQLLARAESLKDIIWIESQLTSRQSELDSLKSQQAYLADQTSESTITIDIQRSHEEEEPAKDEDDTGFLAGLTGGMDALGGFAVAMATIVGALLPFAIVLLVLGLPAWVVVRRSARRRATKQPATP